jgi:Transposase IS66 family
VSSQRPLLAELRDRLLQWKQQLLPRHPMAEAIHYALGQWNELNVFSTDGAVPIDHNVSEREMKRVVLNRKNSLFVGNARGGRTAAILASLTSTCRRHDVDPQHYLTQLLINLPTTRMSELSTWLPDQWKQLQAARMAIPARHSYYIGILIKYQITDSLKSYNSKHVGACRGQNWHTENRLGT